MKKLITSFVLVAGLAIVFNSCKKEDPPLPPNQINFSAALLGFESSSNELKVTVQIGRAETEVVNATISVAAEGLTPGTDFNTVPTASPVDGNITVAIPAGSTSAEITITKSSSLLLSGNEKITLTINSAGAVLPGTNKEVVISLSAIVSTGATNFVMPGKISGSTRADSVYANGVYMDMSNNAALPVDRKSWNIAFTTDATFRVVLNPGYESKALKLNKTDISTPISTADTTGTNLNFGQYSTPLSAVDDLSGDLTKTVFGDIAVNEADAKVVIYAANNAASSNDWYRVKVSRNGEGYKVQYAKYNATNVTTVNIAKNSDYNLVFLSLETGNIVSVEPRGKNWDIQWSYTLYNAGTIAYSYQDFILLNYIGGAQAAQKLVFESDGTTPASEATTIAAFNAFSAANVAGLTFSDKRDAIGDKWRITSPAASASVRKDRFYVIKDPNGNYYKLRFSKAGLNDTGERGRLEIDYQLLN